MELAGLCGSRLVNYRLAREAVDTHLTFGGLPFGMVRVILPPPPQYYQCQSPAPKLGECVVHVLDRFFFELSLFLSFST